MAHWVAGLCLQASAWAHQLAGLCLQASVPPALQRTSLQGFLRKPVREQGGGAPACRGLPASQRVGKAVAHWVAGLCLQASAWAHQLAGVCLQASVWAHQLAGFSAQASARARRRRTSLQRKYVKPVTDRSTFSTSLSLHSQFLPHCTRALPHRQKPSVRSPFAVNTAVSSTSRVS